MNMACNKNVGDWTTMLKVQKRLPSLDHAAAGGLSQTSILYTDGSKAVSCITLW